MPAVANIIVSPVISYRSDRFRSRLGRRVPFLLAITPPAFVSFVGLALSPAIGGWMHGAMGGVSPGRGACVLLCMAFFWLVFDVASVVTNVVHSALVNDVVPREVIGRFFGIFRVVSLGAGMLFNEYVLGSVEKHYVAIFLVIGVAYLVCFMLMCVMVKEGEYPPPPAVERGPLRERLAASVRTYIRECFARPYYRWFFLSFFLAYTGFEAINMFSMYFSQAVGKSTARYGHWSAVQLGCSLVQAPIIGWIADKVHPLRVTIFALCLYALSTALAFLFVRDERTFAMSHVICGTCSGMWLTATAALPQVLLPRLKFATYASVLLICYGVAKLTIGPIVGTILDAVNAGRTNANRDYHLIFLWACIFITLSLLVTLNVHRYFIRYGGPRGYVAPE
jgi:MFS family permease